MYEMAITVRLHPTDTKDETGTIIETVIGEWDGFRGDIEVSEDFEGKVIRGYGEGNLHGGESEREFTDRISTAIWKALGEYRYVEIRATCLEDLPHEYHVCDEDDYERLMGIKVGDHDEDVPDHA